MAGGKQRPQDDTELLEMFMRFEESHRNIAIPATESIPSSSNQMQSQEFPSDANANQPLTFTNPNSAFDDQTLTDAFTQTLSDAFPETLTDPNLGDAYPQTPIDPNSAYAYLQTLTDPNLGYANPYDNPPPNLGFPWEGGTEGTDERAESPPGKGTIRLRYRCGVHPKKAQPYAEWKVSFCPCDFKSFRFTFDKP